MKQALTPGRVLAALPLLALLGSCGDLQLPDVAVMGVPVPAYAAVDLEGEAVSLQDLRGEVVVLNLWATWCAPCREEMPDLEKLHRDVGPQGLRVVAVSIDDAGAGRLIGEFVDEYDLTFTVLHDPDHRITRIFNTRGVPETFLVGRDGTLLHRWFGAVDPAEPEVARVIMAAVEAPDR